MKKNFVVVDSLGLHARTATKLARIANLCPDDIVISYHNKETNVKSIIGLLSLGIQCNSIITIEVTGESEAESFHKITKILKDTKLIN